MALINCETNLVLTWSANCVTFETPVVAKVDTKLNIPLVASSSQDNAALLKQLRSSFKK